MNPIEVKTNDYRSALDGAAFSVRPEAGYLRIGGKDRIDFLNRQSTNDIRLLTGTQSIKTVLTSPTARIQDVLILVDEGDAIGAVTLDGRQTATAKALQGKIFFMDQVTVSDVSSAFSQFDVVGPEAGRVLHDLGLPPVLEDGAVASGEFSGSTFLAIGQAGYDSPSVRIVMPEAASDAFQSYLLSANVERLLPETYEILRIEAGIPAAESELTMDYTPLEASLHEAVSHSKGCYTGQEIIARQTTYDKVTKRLVGLSLASRPAPNTQVTVAGKQAGVVTSSVHSPRFGPIALAYVKRPYDEPGTEIDYIDEDNIQRAATVVPLPFTT